MASSIQLLENDILLVVDVQKDFCAGGILGIQHADEIITTINNLVRLFPHVILTQDWHPKEHLSFTSFDDECNAYENLAFKLGKETLQPKHCVKGSTGAEFHPKLNTTTAELVIRKGYNSELDSYSVFFENDRKTPTGLEGYLRERELDRIFFAGLATDSCILYSAIDAKKLGFEVFVIEDACCGIDIDGSLDDAWFDMESIGVHRLREDDIDASTYV